MDKLFHLRRVGGDVQALVIPASTPRTTYLLPETPSFHGEGFEYGYRGASPVILAASIVADLFRETPEQTADQRSRTQLHAQRVMEEFIAPLLYGVDEHFLSGPIIEAWCRDREEPCEVCRPGVGTLDFGGGPCWACGGTQVQLRHGPATAPAEADEPDGDLTTDVSGDQVTIFRNGKPILGISFAGLNVGWWPDGDRWEEIAELPGSLRAVAE